MFNNLTNFFNLIDLRRFKKTPEPTDVFPMGTRDAKYNGGYKPTFIQWQDLVANICEECGGGGTCDSCCDITMTPITATRGTPVNFLRLDSTPGEDIIVPGVLAIARGDSQPIFNSVTEVGYNFGVSPADTEWNSLYTDAVLNGFGTLTNFSNRTYGTFVEACNNQVGNNVLGLNLVCHVISTNQYFLFIFNAWTMGGVEGGAGFGYTRTEVFVTEPCVLTFSDGTTMTTASVTTPDTNTWNLPGVAVVDPQNGNNATAVVGDGNLPFQTIESAQLASTNILLKAGNYSNVITLTNANYHALDGVVFGTNSRVVDGGVQITATITGHATFGVNSYGVQTTSGSTINVFCKEFNNTRQVAWCVNNSLSSKIYINAYKRIKCNNNNGAGMACRLAGGAKIEVVTPEFTTDHWAAAFPFANSSGNTPEFILRCPKIITSATGFAGNTAKALVNDQGTGSGKSIVRFDLQGGTYENLSLIQTSAFGIQEGALALQGNRTTVGENSVIEMINGTMYANNMAGIYSYYRMTDGIISLKNLNVKSNTYALRLFLGNYNGVGRQTVYADNCKFESPNFEIGNGKECYFSNVTFKNTNVLATSIFSYNAGNPINPLIAYFSNCVAVLENAGVGTLINNSIVGTLYGFSNTPSTEPSLGLNVVDTWGGATQIATLKTSNI